LVQDDKTCAVFSAFKARILDTKHKIPRSYSAAGEGAASSTELGMTNFWEIPKKSQTLINQFNKSSYNSV